MGYDDITASSAVRISLGPSTTEHEVMNFVDAWSKAYKKYAVKTA
jgi:cysteine desulfurase